MLPTEYEGREQTFIKHLALRLYLAPAARILGTWADFVYIDCCAGPWEHRSPDLTDTSFAVASEELRLAQQYLQSQGKTPKFRILLIESDKNAYRLLKQFSERTNSQTFPIQSENWDFTEHLQDITQFARKKGSFSFVFIDPTGWKLAEFNAIEPILRLEPGEVLINFMSSFVTRFLNDPQCNFEGLLDSDVEDLRKLAGHEQEDELVRRYCQALRRRGNFPYVCSLPVMKSDQDAFYFHLIYATRSAKGVKVFKDVEKRASDVMHSVRAALQQQERHERTGNLDLFAPAIQYQETRYQKLRLKNHTEAKLKVLSLIDRAKTVFYDVCWAEALQFATVHENDLREWISAWVKEDRVKIDGLKSPREKLKVRAGYKLISISGAKASG
jgi:three-Cys-motif partner protein